MISGPTNMQISPAVSAALESNTPVVALESTVYSTLGLPAPHNREALNRCVAAIEARGAVPALTALLDGKPHVGISDESIDRILTCDRKVTARDLPVASALGWDAGVTTVSASLALADAAGIKVFATGGIGGVHRGFAKSVDISADLGALAHYQVATVCAGAKSFLDLPATLEVLESSSVPVVGFRTDELPAFWVASSGLPLPYRVDTAEQAAAVIRDAAGTGILFPTPIPADAALNAALVDSAIDAALAEAERDGLVGGAVTPFILSRIASASGGQTVAANVALVANNADVAASIAVALAETP
jgi:pseudouridine-5'-phosphate glycosidase